MKQLGAASDVRVNSIRDKNLFWLYVGVGIFTSMDRFFKKRIAVRGAVATHMLFFCHLHAGVSYSASYRLRQGEVDIAYPYVDDRQCRLAFAKRLELFFDDRKDVFSFEI
jgi:hypothetical protein